MAWTHPSCPGLAAQALECPRDRVNSTTKDSVAQRLDQRVLAIDELDVQAGERVTMLRPNGAGKTTLLRLLAGLEAPTAGVGEIDGVPMADADLDLRRRIGYATQRPALLSTSAIRNVELPLRWRGLDRRARRSAASAALERLNGGRLADRTPLSRSGGEARRVSLARALALQPRLLLLDEPAAGLDAEARRRPRHRSPPRVLRRPRARTRRAHDDGRARLPPGGRGAAPRRPHRSPRRRRDPSYRCRVRSALYIPLFDELADPALVARLCA
jgi:ABC-type nitrate/sulfonate/bicarbonate transport system ATPase subunit